MIKAAILDDDPLSRKILENLINKSNHVELVAQFDNPIEALKEIGNLDCDLLFLDIEMPEMNGIEFIASAENIPQVIVVSSKKEYAADTYNYDVSDYLVKPVDPNRFEQAVSKVADISAAVSKGDEQDHMFIKKNKGYTRINFEDINYLEALADYVQINTDSERFTVLSTMKSISSRLPASKFLRVHRSFIVSLDKIDRLDDNMIMIGDKSIPVSRSYRENLMQRLNLL
ncbi:LytTR family DNA-binding domain-containing protein [Paracrocinitomix mangrovi]|uniref:LytR/AlgR family response regulator transcription factor n=1 Tax=Paracrocinitomix mangrovi TaxID=2862509 RepID=UPI001C8D099C|nr:LytTR family DNA-binding domain-containing protein [Paracrocinitomix mangrovi]UKN00085.1 LytTR family DNA-binding domain-containing protein [Paracrocinitomix mangrovi]